MKGLLVPLFLLTACVTDPLAGSGPLEISPSVSMGFERYKGLAMPMAFAVSEDGRIYEYRYCPMSGCQGSHAVEAIRACEKISIDVPCKLYALKRQIVWQGTVTERAATPPGPFLRR